MNLRFHALSKLGLAAMLALAVSAEADAGSVVVAANSSAGPMDAEAVRRVFLGRETSVGGAPATVVYQAGGPTRQLGLLFATGLMLLNPAAGWALLAGLAAREFARRRLRNVTPEDMRSFAGGTIAGDALHALYDSAWRLAAGRR